MVTVIENAAATSLNSLDYNEEKVERGDACVVAYSNLPDAEKKTVYAEMERLNRLKFRDDAKTGFHMSVNPSETDTCSEEQVLEYIHDLMAALGYGNQPYVVYRHNDIDREHYHVVSNRIGVESHRMIKRNFENRRVNKFMLENQEKYGFTVGRDTPKEKKEVPQMKLRFSDAAYDPKKADLEKQICTALEYSQGFIFETRHQFDCIMQTLGFNVTHSDPDQPYDKLFFQGMNEKGKCVTQRLPETSLPDEVAETMHKTIDASLKIHRLRTHHKEKAENILKSCFKYSKSEEHLKNMLRNHGLYMYKSVSENGELIGLTFVDITTRNAFKGSDLNFKTSLLKDAVNTGKWRQERQPSGNTKKEKIAEGNMIKEAIRSRSAKNAIRLALPFRAATSAGESLKEYDNDKKKTFVTEDSLTGPDMTKW